MRRPGVLEAMAQTDLDVLLDGVRSGYRSGTAELLEDRDPGWRAAVEEKEREVGELFAALCEADLTVRRWRRAVAELRGLWARAREGEQEGPVLREVA
jgi:hypothetical protein